MEKCQAETWMIVSNWKGNELPAHWEKSLQEWKIQKSSVYGFLSAVNSWLVHITQSCWYIFLWSLATFHFVFSLSRQQEVQFFVRQKLRTLGEKLHRLIVFSQKGCPCLNVKQLNLKSFLRQTVANSGNDSRTQLFFSEMSFFSRTCSFWLIFWHLVPTWVDGRFVLHF